jgi:hypothetical protein
MAPRLVLPGRLGLEQHYREAASNYYGNLPEYQIDATVKHLFGQPQNIAARRQIRLIASRRLWHASGITGEMLLRNR